MGIHKDGSLQRLTITAVQIRQGGESTAVLLNSGVIPEELSSCQAAITVGQLHWTAEIRIAEAAGTEGIHNSLRCHRQPFTTAIGTEPRHLQLAGFEQA